jgi:hypothetical protein
MFDIFVFDQLSLYIFTIWKSLVYNLFCRDGIYFDKILVSEYKLFSAIYQLLLHMVFTSRNWFVKQGPVAIILISWNVIFIWETGYWTRAIKRFALFDLLKSLYSAKTLLRHTLIKKYFSHFSSLLYLYTFSLYENASFIIVSAETEYISTRFWYRNINFLRDRIGRIFL